MAPIEDNARTVRLTDMTHSKRTMSRMYIYNRVLGFWFGPQVLEDKKGVGGIAFNLARIWFQGLFSLVPGPPRPPGTCGFGQLFRDTLSAEYETIASTSSCLLRLLALLTFIYHNAPSLYMALSAGSHSFFHPANSISRCSLSRANWFPKFFLHLQQTKSRFMRYPS